MVDADFWPSSEDWLPIADGCVVSNGRAWDPRVAVIRPNGRAGLQVGQFRMLHLFVEVTLETQGELPVFGFELRGQDGMLVHGKHTLHEALPLPLAGPMRAVDQEPVFPTSNVVRLRVRHDVGTHLRPDDYDVSLYVGTARREDLNAYAQADEPSLAMRRLVREHLRLHQVCTVTFRAPERARPAFYGWTNLPSATRLEPVPMEGTSRPAAGQARTLIHATHYKAGSQWIRGILAACFGVRVVRPEWDRSHILNWPVQAGRVYPCCYVTQEELSAVALPAESRVFAVIRDLRDTLVSGYFSARFSHKEKADSDVPRLRARLEALSEEEGLLLMLEEWLGDCAAIQASWLQAEVPVIRYEELLEDDEGTLVRVLIGELGMDVSETVLREAVRANRFEVRSGRERGEEDVHSHRRKGVAGDWKNHFTPRVEEAFRRKFEGGL